MEKSTSAVYKQPSLWNPVIAAGLDGTDKILIPGASECEHSWRYSLHRGNQVRMR